MTTTTIQTEMELVEKLFPKILECVSLSKPRKRETILTELSNNFSITKLCYLADMKSVINEEINSKDSSPDDVCALFLKGSPAEFNGKKYNYDDAEYTKFNNIELPQNRKIMWEGQKTGRDDHIAIRCKNIHIYYQDNNVWYYYGSSNSGIELLKEGNKKEKIPAQYTIYINNYENKKTIAKTHKEAIYAVFKNKYVPNVENNSTGISLLKKIDKEQIFKIARQKTEKRQKTE
tara:strand:+ start:238 stop:936 length:699 start_codon:yes stop_codon:yes gene_type:complete